MQRGHRYVELDPQGEIPLWILVMVKTNSFTSFPSKMGPCLWSWNARRLACTGAARPQSEQRLTTRSVTKSLVYLSVCARIVRKWAFWKDPKEDRQFGKPLFDIYLNRHVLDAYHAWTHVDVIKYGILLAKCLQRNPSWGIFKYYSHLSTYALHAKNARKLLNHQQ